MPVHHQENLLIGRYNTTATGSLTLFRFALRSHILVPGFDLESCPSWRIQRGRQGSAAADAYPFTSNTTESHWRMTLDAITGG